MASKLTSASIGFVFLGLATPLYAEQNPPNCRFASANGAISIGCRTDGTNVTQTLLGQQVVVGQTVFYQVQLNQNSPTLCGFEGGQILITTPDGLTTDATPDGGIPLVCGDPSCSPSGVPLVLSKIVPYTVRIEDIGINQSGFSPCLGAVQATMSYTGGFIHCDENDDCGYSASSSVCNPVRSIGFVAEAAIASATGQVCDATLEYHDSALGSMFDESTPQFCYRYIYRNTGTTGLNVTSAVDSVIGSLPSPGPLAPGAVVTNFSAVPIVTGTTTNTVTALAAQTSQNCFETSVVAIASAIATVVDATNFRITSIVPQESDVLLTWIMPLGYTGVLQACAGGIDGSYTQDFSDICPPVFAPGSGFIITNYLEAGAVTNNLARYYRVRLMP